jgi:uncharacterized protein YkwD
MLRLSPRSRWVVLPTALATAAVATAVAWTNGSNGPAPSSAAAPASFESGPTAGDRPAADRVPADRAAEPADRASRVVIIPPAGRLRPTASPPAPSHSRSPAPPRPTTSAPAPTRTRPTPPSPPAPTTSAPATQSGGVTAAVVGLTNTERAKAGCRPLTVNATLTAVAQAHSQDMATNDYFDHNSKDGRTPFDRMSAAGYRYSIAAENIAAGQRTAQDVITAWMNSPGHRANILNCGLTEIGVGYATASSSQYGVYWTQDFGTLR